MTTHEPTPKIFQPEEIPLGHEPIVEETSLEHALLVLREEAGRQGTAAMLVRTGRHYSVWILMNAFWLD